MTLQQLTYFLATAEHGSFSRAARELYLAQPSLSEQVRSLEAELGVALFARVGRGVVLTEAGRAFRPEAERVLAALVGRPRGGRRGPRAGAAARSASACSAPPPASSSPGSSPTSAPGTRTSRLRLVGQNSSEVAEDVRRGRLEAGLVVLPVDDEGLDIRPIRREEVVYVSREPERVREPVTIERLAASPLILYDAHYGWSDPTRRQLQERAQRAGVQLEPVIEIEDMDAALELAVSGLGDTIAPKAALEHRPSLPTGSGECRSPSRSTTTSPSSRAAAPRSPRRHAPSSSWPSADSPSSAKASSTRASRPRAPDQASMIVASTGGCSPRHAAR